MLAACAQALPIELPDLAQKAPDGMTAAEQRRAIEELDRRKASHASEAAAEIAREKRR